MTKTGEHGPVYSVELIYSLPLFGGMRQAMPFRRDLESVRASFATGAVRVAAGYETLLSHFLAILEDAPTVHLRKCFECKNEAYHADSITPYVNCRKCGSQDTRRKDGAS